MRCATSFSYYETACIQWDSELVLFNNILRNGLARNSVLDVIFLRNCTVLYVTCTFRRVYALLLTRGSAFELGRHFFFVV